ncbi:hypothetical protein [Polyangium mundeleinium]|uniref:Crocagin biosynthetic protein CgnE/B domain-containing protein n=1 Tax=Polyangium mundeleinium TaxID=2995306 RepID=A0ABT5EWE0_9BACT|nr:hypothetical protein [Polyangium mundeleinium]MDC0746131.1 hypothetical protein [Polyangium mundeleinium]
MKPKDHVSLGEQLDRSLHPVFGVRPTYFADSLEVYDFLRSTGCRCHYLAAGDDPASLPEELRANAVLLFTERDNPPRFYDDAFGNSRVLMIPLRPFEPSLRAAMYALERIAQSDFARAAENSRQLINFIGAHQDSFRIQGDGCDLLVQLADEITVMQPIEDPFLQPREWGAIGQWLEVGLIPNGGNIQRSGYLVKGQFLARGTSIARHQTMPEARAHLHREARELAHDLREDGQFPLTLSVEDSRIKEIRTQGGKDIYKEVRRLSGEHTDMVLLELSMSSNASTSSQTIDWSINSVMNEGCAGVHVAVGDGISAAHIDFIATDARIIP